MSGWVKVPESWFEDESVEALGAEAVTFHLSALAYSARHSLDGRVPASAKRRLWVVEDPEATINRLVTSGFWFPLAAGGWQVRDWRSFILSAEEVEHRRSVSRETSERYRRHKLGDHSMCDRCAAVRARDKSGDTSRDKSGDGSVTSSEPNRTDPKGRRGENGAPGPADAAPALAEMRLHTRAHHHFDDGEDECCPLPPENPIHVRSA